MVVRLDFVHNFNENTLFLITALLAETDELLSESPVHLTSLSTDIRNGSFNKSLVGLNGNTNAMGDMLSSGELFIILEIGCSRFFFTIFGHTKITKSSYEKSLS